MGEKETLMWRVVTKLQYLLDTTLDKACSVIGHVCIHLSHASDDRQSRRWQFGAVLCMGPSCTAILRGSERTFVARCAVSLCTIQSRQSDAQDSDGA